MASLVRLVREAQQESEEVVPFDIEMTGTQDYGRNIKLALCGFPGAGKTLFSSTAPKPFFIFMREQPRIMSIANRYIPHTKITNKFDAEGKLEVPIWETYLEVLQYLRSSRGDSYETVVVDTGDELFQAMKEGRKAQNRGKWAIQDWGWLADMYREVINATIDLPKHVIVTYHIKTTQEGEDGEIVREVALQGSAKDDVTGWFDLVGVIDSWVEETKEGPVTHRGILTSTTPKYPFVKDHSGSLPKVFELSENFVGDFKRLYDIVYAEKNIPKSAGEILERVEGFQMPTSEPSTQDIPTPDEVKAKKGMLKKAEKEAEQGKDDRDEPSDPGVEASPPIEEDGSGSEGSGADVSDAPAVDEPGPQPEPGPDGVEPAPDVSEGSAPAKEDGDSPDPGDDSADEDAPDEGSVIDQAEATVREHLDPKAEVVEEPKIEYCQFEVEEGKLCNAPLVKDLVDAEGNKVADENGEIITVPDQDLIDLTKIRFRKTYCRDHFTQLRKG